jgi:TolB-like protein/Flp pilus assembly protein TadD
LSLFNELKRRNVFKVGIAYIVIAWLVAQVLQLILESFGTPDWVMKTVLVLMAAGLLFALFFAWAFELTPEGLKREHEVDRSQSITSQTGKKLNVTITIVMALALGYFAYDKFVLSANRYAALVEATTKAVTEQVANEEVSTESDKSIAVLPFVNMSSDEEQEYFSDGLSEELLNLLARIPDLKVASRSSAFSYKGKDFKIEDVGRELNVAHVLEGSVRKAGNQVRITAQLIKTDDGFHLWSQTWDRSLENIFAIQDEISQAVVDQLRIKLMGDAPKTQVVNPEAYALLLKSRHIYAKWGKDNFEKSLEVLEQALAIEPEYAMAWSSKSAIYMTQVQHGYLDRDIGVQLSLEAAERALELDPGLGSAWGKLVGIRAANYDWEGAEAASFKALELAPNDSSTLTSAGNLAATLGFLDKGLAFHQRILNNDPLQLIAHYNYANVLWKMGKLEESAAAFQHLLELNPEDWGSHGMLAMVYMLQGDPEKGWAEADLEVDSKIQELTRILLLPALGRNEEAHLRLEAFARESEARQPYMIAMAHGWHGNNDQAFHWLNLAIDQGDVTVQDTMTDPLLSALHDDPRWNALLERMNLPISYASKFGE